MSKEKVAVKFLKSWRGYSAGEVACFGDVAASDLVEGKVAELHKGGKASARPAAPAAGEGKGDDAPPNDEPPAGDTLPPSEDPFADDDEPKP